MEIYTYVICFIFCLWFLATIIVQFSETKLAGKVRQYDLLAILPLWTFFAPNPGVNDYHLLYREKTENGNYSDWKEVEINEDRNFYTCIWNPNKRSKKVLNDIAQTITPLTQAYSNNLKAIMYSLPYILVLNTVMKEPKISNNSCQKQFLLSTSDGYDNNGQPKLILLSEFHPI